MASLRNDEADKIDRFIKGQADETETVLVESMFLVGEENFELRNSLKTDWLNMVSDNSKSEKNLDHLLDRIHHTIRRNEEKKKQKPLQKLLGFYMRAAAILLLPLLIAGAGVYTYLHNNNKNSQEAEANSTIYAPLGARVSFTLPDGTNGMLNSGSNLSYSIPFTGNRKVSLVGEAWLDVKHDKDNPFEINTGSSTVKVLGTSLNVSAYPEEKYVEVVLLYGSVMFVNNMNQAKAVLVPSQRLVFKNGNIFQSITDPAKYKAWTEGKLVFRDDPMAEVARRIERWYNVKIILADPELENYSFHGTFEDDKIEEVLRFLSMTSPIRYEISQRKIFSDGTIDKQIVTIHINN
jgi:ferric-dicitrate binding protein FerR (iron transport regulator)